MTRGLQFQKMWEAADTYLFDIDTGSILPILRSLPKVASFADKHFLYYYTNGIGAAYYEEGEMAKARVAGKTDFLNNNYLQHYFGQIENILHETEKFFALIETTDLRSIENKELKKLFEQSIQYIVNVFGLYLACQPQCITGIEELIYEKLNKEVPEEKASELFTLLTTPSHITTMKKEELEWAQLLVEAKKKNTGISDTSLQGIVQEHQSKYKLLNAADGHDPWDLAFFLEKFENDKNTELTQLKQKVDDILRGPEALEKAKRQIIRKYYVSDTIVHPAAVLAEIGHWRFEMRLRGWMPLYYYNKKFVEETASRFKFSKKALRFATVAEILSLFEGKAISLHSLKERQESFLVMIHNDKHIVYAGKESMQIFRALVKPISRQHLREIKGNIAMKGKVRGTVIVFKWTDDLSEKMKSIEDDAVLIAGQTRPQLMPLISKCKAIVTDEGGITSHAALVSRELGIPCIIGTKIATQVLHDGDKVEVDANLGTVTVLKRKK